ncbi:MAG: hypothetical protein OEZ58_23275, partial [Gammaproteobacteria bacterium]|nr:hypothetical protein [Gammaproteobacteria bacterium]
ASILHANAADDVAIKRFVDAKTSLLQTQVNQLSLAINLLKTETLSDQDKFERIGEPSFSAVDAVLANAGYSVRTFYQFAAENEEAISIWLGFNMLAADHMAALEIECEGLISEYDLLINSPANGN